MQSPRRLSIRSTVIGTFLLVITALLLLTWLGQSAVTDMRHAINSLHENAQILPRIITDVNVALRGWSAPIVNHIVEDRPDVMARYEREMGAQYCEALNQLAGLSTLPHFPRDGRLVLGRIEHTLNEAKTAHAEVLHLSGRGHKAEATRLFSDRLKPALDQLEQEMQEFRKLRQTQLDTAVAAAEQHLSTDQRLMTWLIVTTVCSVGLLVLLIVHRISKGTAEVVDAATNVARDVLHQEMPISPTTDETTSMKNTIAALRTALEASLAEQTAVQGHLRELETNLAHASRVSIMGEMASTLAHELTQPLSAIAGYTQACLERIGNGLDTSENLQMLLQKASAETQRAGAIIQRVRSFVRRRPEPREVLDLNDLVREAIAFMEHKIRRRGVQVSNESTQAPADVWGNRIELEQVIVNLVRNSLEAMSTTPDPRLTVRIDRRGDEMVEVAVADQGTGLSPAISDHLFKPFFTTKNKGMGLGLVISQTIIERHGGRLWAVANPDGGATFTFTLPAHQGTNDNANTG